jgi:hypothetical protein
MTNQQLRQRIAFEAARLMFRERTSFHQAKFRAAQQVAGGWVPAKLLPSHREIRAEIDTLARLHDEFDDRLLVPEPETDRFEVYRSLVAPLEHVRQPPRQHPEGDALYHSLQVFDLARDELPYDEEFLLAALLHDVGKAIDPKLYVQAGLEAVEDVVTTRCFWLIEQQQYARALVDNTLGARARRRLEESEHIDELILLARCDRAGRAVGVDVPELDEALNYIRDLAEMCGE